MLGILQVFEEGEEPNVDAILKDGKEIADPNLTDLVKEVSVKQPVKYGEGSKKTVVLIDCGVKYSIIRNLLKRGINVVRVPYDTSASEVMAYNPDGVFLSNGPGDPKKCVKTIDCVREVVRKGSIYGHLPWRPNTGISVGRRHLQIKVWSPSTKPASSRPNSSRCYITTQNHGYAVNIESLKKTPLETWFINANDKTTEGVKHKNKPVFAVQWHPEASPGPYDTELLFDKFAKMLEAP